MTYSWQLQSSPAPELGPVITLSRLQNGQTLNDVASSACLEEPLLDHHQIGEGLPDGTLDALRRDPGPVERDPNDEERG